MKVKSLKELFAESYKITESNQDLSDVIDVVFENYVEETGDEEGEAFDFGLTILSNFADRIPEDIAADIAAIIHDEYLEDGEELEGDEDEEDMEESLDEELLDEKLVKIDVSSAAKKARKEARLRYKKNKAKLRKSAKKYRKSSAGKKQAKKHDRAVKRAGGPKKGKRIVSS